MSVLESVLKYKAQRDAEAQADIQAIPQAITAFTTARQQAQKSALDQLTMQMAVQKFGLEQQMAPFQMEKLQAETAEAKAKTGILGSFFDGQSPGQNGAIATEANIGGIKFVKPELQQRLQGQEQELKNVSDARKNLDEYASAADNALVALDKIEKYASKLPKFEAGFGNQLKARAQATIGEFSKEPKYVEYVGAIAQELSPLARSIAEEKGPLTNKDIDRIEKGLGDLTLPIDSRQKLLNEYREKIKKAIVNKSEIAKLSPDEVSAKYPSLYKRAFSDKDSNLEKPPAPKGAVYFSESTGKYYDSNGTEL